MQDNNTQLLEEEIVAEAKRMGFHKAAFMNVEDMVIIPEYRKYCEMNLCHCYDVLPVCPPQCGTVEEMIQRIQKYQRLLVLQTEHDTDFIDDPAGAKKAKQDHNRMADQLVERFWKEENSQNILRMTAGPWKTNSCMSAYCVDVQKMADHVGMTCWAKDGKCRFFSQILFAVEA